MAKGEASRSMRVLAISEDSQRMYRGLRNYFRCIRLNFGVAFLGLRVVLTGLHVVRKRKQVSPTNFLRALAASFEPRRVPRITSDSFPHAVGVST